MVVTDLAVFTIDKHGKDGMALIELADGVTLDEVKAEDRSRIPGGAEERVVRRHHPEHRVVILRCAPLRASKDAETRERAVRPILRGSPNRASTSG